MKPDRNIKFNDIAKLPGYEFVAEHSFDCYPGWGTRYVWKHTETNTLWARDVFMSDDNSHEGGDWYRVEAVVTTRYERSK